LRKTPSQMSSGIAPTHLLGVEVAEAYHLGVFGS
jgi:hypothetical protein